MALSPIQSHEGLPCVASRRAAPMARVMTARRRVSAPHAAHWIKILRDDAKEILRSARDADRITERARP